MRVAWELSLTKQEVLDMGVEEFSDWGAFLEMVNTRKQ